MGGDADDLVTLRVARREALLDAVVSAIRSDGPSVSMEQLARAAGITKPVLYKHFRDRDGLVEAVGDRFVAALSERVFSNLDESRADKTTRHLLESTLDAYLRFLSEEPALYRFLRTQSHPEGLDLIIRLAAGEVAAVLRERMVHAGLDPRPTDLWAHALLGMALGGGQWWIELSDNDATPATRQQVIDDLVSLLWQGFEGVGLDDLIDQPNNRRKPK